MNKIWRRIVEEQQGAQGSLFNIDYPDATIGPDFDLTDGILKILRDNSAELGLKAMIVKLIEEYGISFSQSQYKNIIKDMEAHGIIKVIRVPEVTLKGKPATSLDFDKYRIKVRLYE